MPVLDIGENIGQWTTTRLVRFIKDMFERDPPGLIGSTSIENLAVIHGLVIQDQISFSRDPNFHAVGGSGEPAFANSWTNWGSPYRAASFWKDPLGFVHLQGVIKDGTVGNAAFVLPTYAQPIANVLAGTISNGAIGRVEIQTDGQVIPQSPSSNTWVSLDTIYFKARS